MPSHFGDMLRDRRRQLGMSIQQVANVIKIKPQIIEFFEKGDFSSMPPRGYAQGMISSYARYLGLNPRTVVNAYFDELSHFERGSAEQTGQFQGAAQFVSARSNNSSTRFQAIDGASRYGQRPPQAGYVSDSSSGHEPIRAAQSPYRQRELSSSGQSASGVRRARYTERDVPQGQQGYRRQAAHGGDAGRTSGAQSQATRPMPARNSRQRGNRSTGDRNTRNALQAGRGANPRYAGSAGYGQRSAPQGAAKRSRGLHGVNRAQRGSAGLDPRIALGGLVVIVILIVIIVVLLVRGCTTQSAADEGSAAETVATSQAASSAAAVTTTGADDDDDSGDAAADAATDDANTDDAATTVPDETVVAISLDDGATSWIEVKLDGESVYADNAVGPFSQEYTVEQSIEITVTNPADVDITNNGEAVSWDTRTAGVARVSITAPQTDADQASTDGDAADAVTADEDGASASE